jgi:hypothetical protein
MLRPIVTREACLVTDFFEERSRASDVANAALFSEDSVRLRKRSTRVCRLTALRSLDQEPANCEQGYSQRKPQAPAAKRMRTREVLQVDSPSKLLGCARPSQHDFLESDRHYRVPRTEQKQCVRQWNMDKQPSVQDLVKAALPVELAFFLTNILEVIDLRMQIGRQQHTEIAEDRCGRTCNAQPLAVPA